MDRADRLQDLWRAVASIPAGRVASYGAIGRQLANPTSGRMVGRWMAQAPNNADVPWWRVLGKDGSMPIAKKDPILQRTQAELLGDEGVEIIDSRVPRRYFIDDGE